MGRHDHSQLNIRSAFALKRARELAEQSGMTMTEVVEDALRGYVPPGGREPVGRLVRKGRLLVFPGDGRRKVTLEEVNAAIDADRNRDLFADD